MRTGSSTIGLNRLMLMAAGLILVSLPLVVYLSTILPLLRPVPFRDEWVVVYILGHIYGGTFVWDRLWLTHNDHQIIIPMSIVIVLARLTAFDTRILVCFNWLVLLGASVLLYSECRARIAHPSVALLAATPLVWLVFSPRQDDNMLVGLNLPLILAMAASISAVWLLSRQQIKWWHVIGAGLSALIASLSFSTGLLVWPAGLVLLMIRWWRSATATPGIQTFTAVWLLTGALFLGVFALTYVPTRTTQGLSPRTLAAFVEFIIIAFGAPFSNTIATATVVGMVILAACLAMLVRTLVVGAWRSSYLFPLGLLLIAFGSMMLIAFGRISWGMPAALIGRYTTFAAMAALGLYLYALGEARSTSRLGIATYSIVAAALMLGVSSAYIIGFPKVRAWAESTSLMEAYVLNHQTTSDEQLKLLTDGGATAWVRDAIPILERYHLGPFRAR